MEVGIHHVRVICRRALATPSLCSLTVFYSRGCELYLKGRRTPSLARQTHTTQDGSHTHRPPGERTD